MLKIEISACTQSLHPAGFAARQQLQEALQGLGFYDALNVAVADPAVPDVSVLSTDNPEPEAASTALEAAPPPPSSKRERGKPGPGRLRRSREEMLEDEAADRADAEKAAASAPVEAPAEPELPLVPEPAPAPAPVAAPAPEPQQIQVQPENRVEPEKPPLRFGPNGEYDHETVRSALDIWKGKVGLPKMIEQFKEAIKYEKVSAIPLAECRAVVDQILAMVQGAEAFG